MSKELLIVAEGPASASSGDLHAVDISYMHAASRVMFPPYVRNACDMQM